MLEGYDVRISGQDVGRGTFSHRYVSSRRRCRLDANTGSRHAMLVDQKTEEVIVPLNESLQGGRLELANSMSPIPPPSPPLSAHPKTGFG